MKLFEGLPELHLRWFGEHGTRVELAEKERMFEDGQVADYLFVVVTGVIERFEKTRDWHTNSTTQPLPCVARPRPLQKGVIASPNFLLRWSDGNSMTLV